MAYITVEDLRAEGVGADICLEPRLQERIDLAQALVEKLTGRFFEAREDFTLRVDGSGHDILWLPIPPVDVDAITSAAISGEAVDPEDYFVDMPTFPDGRFAPALIRTSGEWTKGKRNIVVTGTFGHVDVVRDGETVEYHTPRLIKTLVMRICIDQLPRLGDVEAQRASRIMEETLKDYTYKLDTAARTGRYGDPHIDRLLAMFHKPVMGTV